MEQKFIFNHQQQQTLGSDQFTLMFVAEKKEKKKKKGNVARTYNKAAKEIGRFSDYRCLYDTKKRRRRRKNVS